MIYIIITIAVLIIGGSLLFSKLMGGRLSAGIQQKQEEATASFRADEQNILKKYWEDPMRFKMFKEAIPNEEITGIMNCFIPESLSKNIKDRVLTAVTNIETFDMATNYLLTTEKNMYLFSSNGKEAIALENFPFSQIDSATILESKGGSEVKLRYSNNGKEYTFQLFYGGISFPRFEVVKSFSKQMLRTANEGYKATNPFERKFLNDNDIDDSIHNIVIHKYNKQFIDKLQETLYVRFPESWQY